MIVLRGQSMATRSRHLRKPTRSCHPQTVWSQISHKSHQTLLPAAHCGESARPRVGASFPPASTKVPGLLTASWRKRVGKGSRAKISSVPLGVRCLGRVKGSHSANVAEEWFQGQGGAGAEGRWKGQCFECMKSECQRWIQVRPCLQKLMCCSASPAVLRFRAKPDEHYRFPNNTAIYLAMSAARSS